ncbi:MAG: hypothetical protein QW514_07955 [Thermoprotei archaeon]
MSGGALEWFEGVLPRGVLSNPHEKLLNVKFIEKPSAQMCLSCRASKMLCGRSRCPILISATQLARHLHLFNPTTDFFSGASPPSVFVGRIGYPKVYAGPLVSSHPDPWLFDLPESWLNLSVDTIVGYRFELLRGTRVHSVSEAADPPENLIRLHELVLSSRSVGAELKLKAPPQALLALSDDVEPMGPIAPYEELKVGAYSSDGRIEKVFYDVDLRAVDAVMELYLQGVEVSRIQKLLSVGMVGEKRRRKLVPTRWSITAVDTVLSERLAKRVVSLPEVGETYVYIFENLGSTYIGFIFPGEWSYEWVEAWQPRTVWNPGGQGAELTGDTEDWRGRTTYAEPGGCYYAARLAAVEGLLRLGRKGRVVILREIHSGYMMPLGVWSVREAVRSLFKQRPERFSDVLRAVSYGVSKSGVHLNVWLTKARLLSEVIHQRRIDEYVSGSH